ncbi:hypothetical protein D3C72_2004900 [compost metagenome]
MVAFGQLVDGAEDKPVVMPIEIAIGHRIEHPLPGVVVEHQATQHGLLGLDRVRRHFQGGGLQVVLLGNADVVHRALGKKSAALNFGNRKTKGTASLAQCRARC